MLPYGAGSVLDPLSKDVSQSDEEKVKPEFYGEKLLFAGPAEDAFEIIGDYNKAINLQEGKTILVKYPPSIPEANIKNIIIKLKKREIVVGLQRLPDILY